MGQKKEPEALEERADHLTLSGEEGEEKWQMYRHWQVSECSVEIQQHVPCSSVGAVQPAHPVFLWGLPSLFFFPVQAQTSPP